MSDPVADAVERALRGMDYEDRQYALQMSVAATKLAESVQELHRPLANSRSALHPAPLCRCGKDFPCETAIRVYSSKELSKCV